MDEKSSPLSLKGSTSASPGVEPDVPPERSALDDLSDDNMVALLRGLRRAGAAPPSPPPGGDTELRRSVSVGDHMVLTLPIGSAQLTEVNKIIVDAAASRGIVLQEDDDVSREEEKTAGDDKEGESEGGAPGSAMQSPMARKSPTPPLPEGVTPASTVSTRSCSRHPLSENSSFSSVDSSTYPTMSLHSLPKLEEEGPAGAAAPSGPRLSSGGEKGDGDGGDAVLSPLTFGSSSAHRGSGDTDLRSSSGIREEEGLVTEPLRIDSVPRRLRRTSSGERRATVKGEDEGLMSGPRSSLTNLMPQVIPTRASIMVDPDMDMDTHSPMPIRRTSENALAHSVASLLGERFRHTKHLIKRRDPITRERFLNQYRIIRELGRGTCGKVKLACDSTDETPIAIKQVERADMGRQRIGGPSAAQQRYKSFLKEVDIMRGLRHKNIVSVYEIIDDPNADKLYLVMQYVDRGAIGSVEVRNGVDECCKPIPADLLAGYVRQMLAGLEYLHNHNVVHRDLKPENILLSAQGQVFLADFGVAETFDGNYREKVEKMMAHSMAQSMAMSVAGGRAGGPKVLGTKGTMLFIAPELWRNEKAYGKAVDMWAIGVTIYTLLTGRLPFRNLDEISDPSLPHIPTEFGPGWSQLLHGMLNRDPKRRTQAGEAREVVKHIIAQQRFMAEAPDKAEEILRAQRLNVARAEARELQQAAASLSTAGAKRRPLTLAPDDIAQGSVQWWARQSRMSCGRRQSRGAEREREPSSAGSPSPVATTVALVSGKKKEKEKEAKAEEEQAKGSGGGEEAAPQSPDRSSFPTEPAAAVS